MREFSPEQARRIALRAQGFDRVRPPVVTARHLNDVLRRLGLFQIDSVNVLMRAQYMPLFSRLGPYERNFLDLAAGKPPRKLFEYWAHEAALVDMSLYGAMRFRMESDTRMWGSMRRVAAEHPEIVSWVLDEVRNRGPLTARQIELDVSTARDNWGWNWSIVKSALEYLFYKGEVTSARRNAAFERLYDIPQRVIAANQLEAAPLTAPEAHRHLIEFASRALGLATEPSLRDYFRLQPGPSKQAVAQLVESGDLIAVTVRGWRRPAYLNPAATVPRAIHARSLLSPFDPLIFHRPRTEELFGFRYRIEIYVPEAQRVHGYYVLPFLLGDSLVARVDLKADRAGGRLLVQSAWVEPDAPAETAAELAAELMVMASWLGLREVVPPTRGDLAADLAHAIEAAGPVADPILG